jgi:1,4-alpha-glucan branching enzyme
MTKRQKGQATSKIAKTKGRRTTTKKAALKGETSMNTGIKKEYLKSRNVCKVTFRLPKIAANDAKSVCIVGDFNDWGIHANPMKKLRSGDYAIMLELEPGRSYQFRYLIDESRWENDWNADRYVKSPYGDSDNSVIIL